jgi:hypothetical protein
MSWSSKHGSRTHNWEEPEKFKPVRGKTVFILFRHLAAAMLGIS